LVIIGCTLHEGVRWIDLPAQRYIADVGAKRWNPMIKVISRAACDRFQAVGKEAIDPCWEGS